MKTAARLGIVYIVFCFLCTCIVTRAQTAPMISDSGAAARIQWWRDAKFGLFMHWGVYTIPGRGEWVQWNEQIPVQEYAKLAAQFHPDKFDPAAWAAIAKDAGMRYTVLTARHHDGFALFDDPGSDFTSMKSAAHRDFVAEYVKAVRAAGLHVGLYYSPLDWRYPGFFFPQLYLQSAVAMREQYHRQLHELASNYGKIDILWFDGGGVDWLGFGGVTMDGSGWHARPKGERYSGTFTWQDDRAVADLRKLQLSIIVNDRTDAPADFRSREGDGAMGDFNNKYPWELCTTLTRGAWGYQPNAQMKPLDMLIRLLVSAVGRDGNLLLNVPPRADGQIDPAYVERLHEIGNWLRKYGESIYSTRGGPYLPGDFGVSTYRDKTIYLHFLKAGNEKVVLPALPAKIVSCSMLTPGEAACKQTGTQLAVTLSGTSDAPDKIVAVSLATPATDIPLIDTPVEGHNTAKQ